MNNINIPKYFKKRIANTHGEIGLSWLNNLQNIITKAETTYNLSNIEVLPNLSFNYTATARQNNDRNLIVKFCLPGNETDNEIDALNEMSGDGIVQLIDYDKKQGVLLLEECLPGNTLASVDDEHKATRIIANIIKKIQKPKADNHRFPTTRDWFKRLEVNVELPSGFESSHIDKAKNIAIELHQDMDAEVLLHGDLHHFNILFSQRQPWLAIDPKGVVGPPEYECGAFLRNPIPEIASKHDLKSILSDRIDIFTDILGFDRQVIIAWGYVQAILAGVWCIDMKSEDWRVFLSCANALFKLLED